MGENKERKGFIKSGRIGKQKGSLSKSGFYQIID
jgi:hypothetical protein